MEQTQDQDLHQLLDAAGFRWQGKSVRAKAKAFRVRWRATVGRLAIEEQNGG
jgi:hypothetical protein